MREKLILDRGRIERTGRDALGTDLLCDLLDGQTDLAFGLAALPVSEDGASTLAALKALLLFGIRPDFPRGQNIPGSEGHSYRQRVSWGALGKTK